MEKKKETYLMKLVVILFVLAAASLVGFGALMIMKFSFKTTILLAVAAFMFCVWAILLIFIDKKADKNNKNTVMAKPEEVQKEILEKLDEVVEIKKDDKKKTYCAHCGALILSGEKVCSQCGSTVQKRK